VLGQRNYGNANPLSGREIVGAALNRLLRLAFVLVKNQTFYQVPEIESIDSLANAQVLLVIQAHPVPHLQSKGSPLILFYFHTSDVSFMG
jgi:hypothetical protein